MSQKDIYILAGPSHVGKGFTVKRMGEAFSPEEVTYFELGDSLRKRRGTDITFNRIYGPLMDRGDLIPDDMIADHILSSIQASVAPKVVIDGACRTRRQVDTAIKHAIISPGNSYILLSAGEQTCRQRCHDRKERFPGQRSDEGSFDNRRHTFLKHIPSVVTGIKHYGLHMVKVDANRDLHMVADDVIEYIRCGKIPNMAPLPQQMILV